MADVTPAPSPGHSPSADRPSSASTWVVLMGGLSFLTGILASAAETELGWPLLWPLLVPVIALGGAVALFAHAGKGLHRDKVQTRVQLLAAWVATAAFLAAYIGLTVWASQTDGSWVTLLTAACLTTAASISLRTVIRPRGRRPQRSRGQLNTHRVRNHQPRQT